MAMNDQELDILLTDALREDAMPPADMDAMLRLSMERAAWYNANEKKFDSMLLILGIALALLEGLAITGLVLMQPYDFFIRIGIALLAIGAVTLLGTATAALLAIHRMRDRCPDAVLL